MTEIESLQARVLKLEEESKKLLNVQRDLISTQMYVFQENYKDLVKEKLTKPDPAASGPNGVEKNKQKSKENVKS